MRSLIIAASLLASTSAMAGWATGDCTTQKGTNIKYMISNGKGFIFYDGDGPFEVFSKREKNFGVITHIGDRGTMNMAIDLDTGRGYIITQHDSGQKVEGNIACKLGYRG